MVTHNFQKQKKSISKYCMCDFTETVPFYSNSIPYNSRGISCMDCENQLSVVHSSTISHKMIPHIRTSKNEERMLRGLPEPEVITHPNAFRTVIYHRGRRHFRCTDPRYVQHYFLNNTQCRPIHRTGIQVADSAFQLW